MTSYQNTLNRQFYGDVYAGGIPAKLEKIGFHTGIASLHHNALPDTLSHREGLILGLAGIGFTYKETGKILTRSKNTVKDDFTGLFRKLQIGECANKRDRAISLAFETGILVVEKYIEPPLGYDGHISLFGQLGQGLSYKSIVWPEENPKTLQSVKMATRNVREDLGLPDRTSLVFYAHLAGWLPDKRSAEHPLESVTPN